jgi:hypothetical protein
LIKFKQFDQIYSLANLTNLAKIKQFSQALFTNPISINSKDLTMVRLYGSRHSYCMGFIIFLFIPSFILSFFFFSFLFLFLFLFFSFVNYLQNEILFTTKNTTRVKKFQSPIDPMKHRVITVASPGDGAPLVRCQEPASLCLERFSPLFILQLDLFYFENLVARWLGAFSTGFNHLPNITHT